MNIKKFRIFLLGFCLLFFAKLALANLPYHPIQLPRDDAAHYENTPYPVKQLTEWWYYNGKLTSKSGRKLGYYLSCNYVFHIVNGKKIIVPMFQIQISDIDKNKVYGKSIYFLNNREFSFSTQVLNVALGKQFTLKKNNNTFLLDGEIKTEQGEVINFSMQLTPTREHLLVGKTGLIDMGEDTNSYYYTYTRLQTVGHLKLGNEVFEIDPQHSLSWMDHQWGDYFIVPWKYQWMWASVQLENGMDILLGVVLDPKTKEPIRGSANYIFPDNKRGLTEDIKNDFFYVALRKPDEKHPQTYDLTIRSLNLNLRLDSLVQGQDVNGIWEGVSDAMGYIDGNPVKGQAYTENMVMY